MRKERESIRDENNACVVTHDDLANQVLRLGADIARLNERNSTSPVEDRRHVFAHDELVELVHRLSVEVARVNELSSRPLFRRLSGTVAAAVSVSVRPTSFLRLISLLGNALYEAVRGLREYGPEYYQTSPALPIALSRSIRSGDILGMRILLCLRRDLPVLVSAVHCGGRSTHVAGSARVIVP